MFRGSFVALVTPMQADGSLDLGALDALVEWHVESGTHGLVPVGTTGESPTVTMREHQALIDRVTTVVAGRLPVLAGTGANSTAEALELTEGARRSGADAALLVSPYYNRPTQAGLLAHYRELADRVDLPQVLYNVPSRTAGDILPETVIELSRHPNIVGIKEASGRPERIVELRDACDDGFCLLSGEDALNRTLMLLGAGGCISVTANVAPVQMAAFCDAMLAGDLERAAGIDQALQPVHAALFCESSPTPTKWALERMGRIGPGIRLPLLPLSASKHAVVTAALESIGVS